MSYQFVAGSRLAAQEGIEAGDVIDAGAWNHLDAYISRGDLLLVVNESFGEGNYNLPAGVNPTGLHVYHSLDDAIAAAVNGRWLGASDALPADVAVAKIKQKQLAAKPPKPVTAEAVAPVAPKKAAKPKAG